MSALFLSHLLNLLSYIHHLLNKHSSYIIALGTLISFSCNLDTPIINGYTNSLSYFANDTCTVYINSHDSIEKTIEVFDINGKVVHKIEKIKLFAQDTNKNKPWLQGFGYKKTFEYLVPELPSGMYFLENSIRFFVKSKKTKEVTVVYPTNTINAYATSGGKSLYRSTVRDKKKAVEVSFLRPLPLWANYDSKMFYQWLIKKGYSINWICDKDMDDYNNISDTKLILITGHSEYWTKKARENFDRFIDDGGNAVILSGNTMWWQIRYNNQKNTMICYKDYEEDTISNKLLKTIEWYRPQLKYPIIPSIGSDFFYGGYGLKEDKGWNGYKIVTQNSPLLEKTSLKRGDIINLPSKEYDGTLISKFTKDSIPLIDKKSMNCYKIELIGFDLGSDRGNTTVGTFIAYQKSKGSGVIINMGSMNWISEENFFGNNKKEIQQITLNSISKLVNGESIFTEN